MRKYPPVLLFFRYCPPRSSLSWNPAPIRGRFGSYTLWKTFGYRMRVNHKVSIPVLTEIINHRTQWQTLDYSCVQPDGIKEVYMLGVGDISFQ